MTVRVTIKENDGSHRVVMFGDSYKKWTTQFEEWIWNQFSNNVESAWKFCDSDVQGRVVDAAISKSAWISHGGLKWCNENIFQDELNREGASLSIPPRQYKDFKFAPYSGNKLNFYK